MRLRLLSFVIASAVMCGMAAAQNLHAKASKEALGSMADCFVQNKGQWDSRAKFLLQKPGMNLWLTQNGAVFDLHKKEGQKIKGDVVAMHFVGAGVEHSTGLKQIPGDFNYFFGQDRSKWRTHVHRYEEVQTGEIYKGIALRYYMDQGSPRYDLIVKPGADPTQVAMKFDGAQDVRVASNGDLVVKTPFGELAEKGLIAYQLENGKRKQVGCRMAADARCAKFITGAYDKSKPLVIDPVLIATYYYTEQDITMLQASNDDLVIVQSVSGSSFHATAGAYQTSALGQGNLVLARLNATYSDIEFATYIGSQTADSGGAYAVGLTQDSSGNYAITGDTTDKYFPVTTDRSYVNWINPNLDNVFALKIDSTGSNLLFCSIIGPQWPYASTVDASGNIWVCGDPGYYANYYWKKTDNSSGPGGFVAELSADGSTLLVSTMLEGAVDTTSHIQAIPYDIAVDKSGNVFVAGLEENPQDQIFTDTFPATPGALFATGDGFIAKLNASNGATTAVSDLPTSRPPRMVVNSSGNPVVFIGTTATGLPTSSNAVMATAPNTSPDYVAVMSPDLTKLVAGTYLGGTTLGESADGLLTDGPNNVILFGESSGGFPTTPGAFISSSGYGGSFLTKLNSSLSKMLYSSYLVDGPLFVRNAFTLDSGGNPTYIGGPPRAWGVHYSRRSGTY